MGRGVHCPDASACRQHSACNGLGYFHQPLSPGQCPQVLHSLVRVMNKEKLALGTRRVQTKSRSDHFYFYR
jgi:hypothetical protein